MAKPQQPELRRSGRVPALDPDASEAELSPQGRPDGPGGAPGPVPVDQRPGHHPEVEQDKPDLDDFAEKLGVEPDRKPDRWRPDTAIVSKSVAGLAFGAGVLWQLIRTLRGRRR